jgi:hypothetical protein
MSVTTELRGNVGSDPVFVIPIGPNCQSLLIADSIESIRFFSPKARIILVDDSGRRLGTELGDRFQATVREAPSRCIWGTLSEPFRGI